jgi:hypothetical protein
MDTVRRTEHSTLRLICLTIAIAVSAAAGQPTANQLTAALKVSAAATKLPNFTETIPPLASLTSKDGAPPGINAQCYVGNASSVPVNAATLCAWADLNSKNTLFVFGDSQASMWLTTLIPIAVQLHWKIIEVAHTGCPPWPGQSAIGENGGSESQCVQWVDSELAFEKTLKPSAVLAVGDGFHDGMGHWATESIIAAGERELVKDVAPARVLLLSPIPMFATHDLSYTPSECLAAATSLTQCDFSPKVLVESVQFEAAKAAAASTHETFIDVTPYFCTTTVCPTVVSDHGERIVYLDGRHANRYWMAFLAKAMEPQIAGGL